MFRGTVKHCYHRHVCSSIVNMTSMSSYWILIGFKNTTGYFPDFLFCALWLPSLRCFRQQLCRVNRWQFILLADMQHSQPHITLYWEVIFFSWCGKILRKFELLMMILFSAYLASLSPPSSGGLTILLCSSLTNTWNDNLRTNCGSTWPSMDKLIQSLGIGDTTNWGCCIIQL